MWVCTADVRLHAQPHVHNPTHGPTHAGSSLLYALTKIYLLFLQRGEVGPSTGAHDSRCWTHTSETSPPPPRLMAAHRRHRNSYGVGEERARLPQAPVLPQPLVPPHGPGDVTTRVCSTSGEGGGVLSWRLGAVGGGGAICPRWSHPGSAVLGSAPAHPTLPPLDPNSSLPPKK